MNESSRMKYLDNSKWILTLLIVLYHIDYPAEGGNWEAVFMFIKNLGDCVVPAFALISGFLFFSNVRNINDILAKIKRRVFTLLIPYVLWNIVNVYFIYLLRVGISGILNREPIEIDFYRDIIMGNASPHFWYIFMLMFWSAFAPILYIAYRDHRGLLLLMISQLIYIIYKGNNIYHSRFIYILYTWGGGIGFFKPDIFEKIKQWSVKIKVYVSVLAALFYFVLSFFIMSYDIDMQFRVWLYLIKAVFLILVTINLPFVKLGKVTEFRYSFWIFAIHYWLDVLVGRYISPMCEIAYQFLVWVMVLVIGLGSGVIINRLFPKCFSILTGNRMLFGR